MKSIADVLEGVEVLGDTSFMRFMKQNRLCF